jgi:hypothetical protein
VSITNEYGWQGSGGGGWVLESDDASTSTAAKPVRAVGRRF